MFRRVLVPLAVASIALLDTTSPTPAPASAPPVMAAHQFDLSQLAFEQPMAFGLGGNGKPSPAGCKLTLPIQQPHVSTYEKVMKNGHAMKGKAYTSCGVPVQELTLSVSIFDYGAHKEILEGRPTGNKNQKALGSEDTTVPCVNTNTTTYQVGVLGTSYESDGGEYWQIAFSKPVPLPCGYA
jgi:hypothetical protein